MNIERLDVLSVHAHRHAALSDVMRLAVVDELAIGDKSPGELQSVLDLSSSLLAHHLKVLQAAGIVSRRRSEGDRRRTYLTLTDPSAVVDAQPGLSAGRVVFVCTANSARSQLAAALWGQVSGIPASSAGTHPAEAVAPGARAVADRRNLTLNDKLQSFLPTSDADELVVAVCDNAYEELGDAVAVHWSVPDPVRIGDAHAFEVAYEEISRRVGALAPRLIAS